MYLGRPGWGWWVRQNLGMDKGTLSNDTCYIYHFVLPKMEKVLNGQAMWRL